MSDKNIQDQNKKMLDIEELFAIDLPIEANYQLPDATLLNYYKLRANRIMEIRKDIDESLFNEMQQIILWNIEDKDIPVEKKKTNYFTSTKLWWRHVLVFRNA